MIKGLSSLRRRGGRLTLGWCQGIDSCVDFARCGPNVIAVLLGLAELREIDGWTEVYPGPVAYQ